MAIAALIFLFILHSFPIILTFSQSISCPVLVWCSLMVDDIVLLCSSILAFKVLAVSLVFSMLQVLHLIWYFVPLSHTFGVWSLGCVNFQQLAVTWLDHKQLWEFLSQHIQLMEAMRNDRKLLVSLCRKFCWFPAKSKVVSMSFSSKAWLILFF